MLSIRNLKKKYVLNKTNSVDVLKGLDIDFRENEFVSILGASGCGKTTFLNIVGGLDKYNEGEVKVDDISTKSFKETDWDNYRNKKIGFVFQSYNLIPHINIWTNVALPLLLAGKKKAECKERAIELLKLVGLEAHAFKKPLQLSGGQMQRVAIARALISDPDIILADEPTGALDNESSIQVMALLKQISEGKLVIMVTHNNQLAEEYSTRIINLTGGKVSGDTNPYYPETEKQTDETANPVNLEKQNEEEDKQEKTEKSNIVSKLFSQIKGRVNLSKIKSSHLPFRKAVELSWRNLISKKVRTSLTAFAGSIGIIGIVLVLAFTSGVNAYISGLEKGALSMYPIQIKEEDDNRLLEIADKILDISDSDRESHPNTDDIYINPALENLMGEIGGVLLPKNNDLATFKTYLEENFDSADGYVQYDYGTKINVYCEDPAGSDKPFMKVHPMTDLMGDVLGGSGFNLPGMTDVASNFAAYVEVNGSEILSMQYDIVGNGSWPKSEVYIDENGMAIAEVVLIVDEKNQINDYALFMLGMKSGTKEEILGSMTHFSESDATFKPETFIGKEYYILAGCDYFEKVNEGAENEYWHQHPQTEQKGEYITSHCNLKARVVAVVRPKPGVAAALQGGTIGYNAGLKNYLIQYANDSEVVNELKDTVAQNSYGNSYWKDVTDPDGDTLIESEYLAKLKEFGAADISKPKAIKIYATSFEGKEKIIKFIDEYNALQEEENNPDGTIKYSDTLETLMSFVNTLTSTVSTALIGFMSVSLVVSSIMIAIIIYTSVLERRKEVGVLRSIGAKKRDIVAIFMSESGILGLTAGLLGAFIAWIVTLPLNVYLAKTVGIANLAIVEWWHVVAMILVSLILSVVAGTVPAIIGANQDPAVALRSE